MLSEAPQKSADSLPIEVVRCEFTDDDQQKIVGVILGVIDKYVLAPTRVSMNPDEIKLLEREVERTSLVAISRAIKQGLDEAIEPTFHVVYGRGFGCHVTHERCQFCHVKIDDADIVVWKHGK